MMDRRSFIRSLAAALPAGAVASQVQAETDPVKAAYTVLIEAVKQSTPAGMTVHKSIMFIDGNLVALAYPPNWQKGQPMAVYDAKAGGWTLDV